MDQIVPRQEREMEYKPQGRRESPRRGRGGLSKAALACSAAALAVSLAALWMAWPEREPEQPAEPEVVEAFSSVEYISYRNHQLPIDESVAVNGWDAAAFAPTQEGWITYHGGGVTARTGIDVSSHQGEIDWQQVAGAGIEFAMLRAGYRGYGEEGRLVIDEQFQTNLRGALDAGLEVGVYFFSQATTVWEAEEEAQLLLDTLKGADVTYPVVFDWERVHTSAARTDAVTAKSVTLMAEAFCSRVAQAGYTPGIYFNQDMGYLELDLERLSDCVFWLAEYDERPEFYYHFDLWQYSCTGAVPGIGGDVDLNLSFRDFGGEQGADQSSDAAGA